MMENEEKKGEKLRTGFTTGSAATAAAVASIHALFRKSTTSSVTIWTPSGSMKVAIASSCYSDEEAQCCVIKDAGDDPDCTHGITIVAMAFKSKPHDKDFFKNKIELTLSTLFECYTGEGIGVVTSEGLPVKQGEPAINPIPRKMLKKNIEELIKELAVNSKPLILLSVPEGVEVAKHTLNERLGIKGGISILGTTGVVKPISMEAFTATIDLSLKRAKLLGLKDVVLCFGRSSEEAAMSVFDYPEEAYIMMGDFFKYTLKKAKNMGFNVILAGQLAKMLKVCLDAENTNVKYGVFSPDQVVGLLRELGLEDKDINLLSTAKTARHILEIVEKEKIQGLWEKLVGHVAKMYKIKTFLFSYRGKLLAKA